MKLKHRNALYVNLAEHLIPMELYIRFITSFSFLCSSDSVIFQRLIAIRWRILDDPRRRGRRKSSRRRIDGETKGSTAYRGRTVGKQLSLSSVIVPAMNLLPPIFSSLCRRWRRKRERERDLFFLFETTSSPKVRSLKGDPPLPPPWSN